MTVNFPLGYDGGDAGIITAKAFATISGGQAVGISGLPDVVNVSGNASFNAFSDMHASPALASGLDFVGIATQYAASGTPVAIATRGAFIVRAANTVTANRTVSYTGDNDGYVTATTAGHVVGRALTAATSGGYFVLLLGR